MGLMQRQKGARVERELVQHLRLKGYQAQRVPLSGATTFCKGDIEVIVNGEKKYIEVKSRKDGFKGLYNLLEGHTSITDLTSVSVTSDFASFHNLEGFSIFIAKIATVPTLKKLKGGCDYLAVKANGKPFLFLEFNDDKDNLPLP